jgi:hypothetical protein
MLIGAGLVAASDSAIHGVAAYGAGPVPARPQGRDKPPAYTRMSVAFNSLFDVMVQDITFAALDNR